MSSIYIKNATIVNDGRVFRDNILISGEVIKSIGTLDHLPSGTEVIDAEGLFLLPGVIDDQVHFREPGLTQKGNIFSESRGCSRRGNNFFYGYAQYCSKYSFN